MLHFSIAIYCKFILFCKLRPFQVLAYGSEIMRNYVEIIKQKPPLEKSLLLAAILLPPPVTLDHLVGLGTISPVRALQAMGSFVDNGIICVAAEGPGHYQLRAPKDVKPLLSAYTRNQIVETAEILIRIVKASDIAISNKCLVMANIMATASYVRSSDLVEIRNAAEYCLEIGAMEAATSYFQLILANTETLSDRNEQHLFFIDAALGLISSHGHLMPLRHQRDLLLQAGDRARSVKNAEKVCLISLRLAQVYKAEGDYKKASTLYEEAWDIAKKLNRDDLLKQAALFTSDFLFWQGLVADAVARYEQVIGDAENFPADQATLRATATLGWCYGICGQTARGVGLIEAVRNRAEGLKLVQVKIYADLMSVLILLDARRISEAEIYLDNIFKFPEETLGNYILWAAYATRAYILSVKGDLNSCFKFQKKAYEKSKEVGWHHHRGPYNFDYMDALEDAGMVHPEMNYDSEIRRLCDWPDVYMQGVGLRYRAQRSLKNNGLMTQIVDDLNESTRLLTRAGARIELAHTQLLLARLKLREQTDSIEARSLLKSAWEVLSSVNPELFPDELRPYLEYEASEEAAIATLLEVGDVIGTVRDRDRLLTRIINLLMRLTGAGRGGVFLKSSEGLPVLIASRNLDEAIIESRQFKQSWTIVLQVLESGKEMIPTEKNKPSCGWRLCYPVTLRNRLFGVIYLDNTLMGLSPPQNIISLLKLVISQMAVAIDNANAYEEIEILKDRLENETRFYRMELDCQPQSRQIVGDSKTIRAVLSKVEKVAETDSTVLITGETGAGKELVARAIHRQSERRDGPFIPINTASLNAEIIASELFGHEKGAFTGASHQRRGRFELADGGTLFLDDIDAISLEIQAKILRAIQEKEFERVGGSKTIQSDFRLIAATNADLKEQIKRNKFRADLYYRLNVFPIQIPPLRERKEDIMVLAAHFLQRFNQKMGRRIKGFTRKDTQVLTDYAWPGNVRELKHIIERAVILSEGPHIILPELNENIGAAVPEENFLSYREMERKHILSALTKSNGRVSGKGGAAELLDLKPSTLYAKIRKFGIEKNFSSPSESSATLSGKMVVNNCGS